MNVQVLFYDVPCTLEVSEKYGMKYALFSCPFEAMSFAAARGRAYRQSWPLQINRRPWDKNILMCSWIEDYR